jgi:lysophospholipase L1-like esterase
MKFMGLAMATTLCWVNAATDDFSCNSTAVGHDKKIVVGVGDSITKGFACNTWHSGYMRVLQSKLGDENYDVRDCGVGGTVAVKNGHGNNPKQHPSYWSHQDHKQSLAMNPDVVIFMLGTNDASEWSSTNKSTHNTSEFYNQDWKELVTAYNDLPSKPKVFTMIPPPFGNFTCSDSSQTCNTNINCVINCILPKLVPELTRDVGLTSPVDLMSLFGGPDNTNASIMPNLHPNCDGYAAIGTYIAKQVFGV